MERIFLDVLVNEVTIDLPTRLVVAAAVAAEDIGKIVMIPNHMEETRMEMTHRLEDTPIGLALPASTVQARERKALSRKAAARNGIMIKNPPTWPFQVGVFFSNLWYAFPLARNKNYV